METENFKKRCYASGYTKCPLLSYTVARLRITGVSVGTRTPADQTKVSDSPKRGGSKSYVNEFRCHKSHAIITMTLSLTSWTPIEGYRKSIYRCSSYYSTPSVMRQPWKYNSTLSLQKQTLVNSSLLCFTVQMSAFRFRCIRFFGFASLKCRIPHVVDRHSCMMQ
jgi:hypothetical protein